MAISFYVTFDNVSQFTGAGKVIIHELNALREVTDIQQVLTRVEISPRVEQFYGFNPFIFDYFAADLVKFKDIDLAQLSCAPGMAILNRLRPKKYIAFTAAHELQDSIDEHIRFYGSDYPFPHNVDEYLHDCLIKHQKYADVVLVPSKGSAEWVEKHISPKRIEIIPHGCDLPEQVIYSENFTNVGYIGAWGPDKGLPYLVRAWSILNYSDSVLYFFGGDSTGDFCKQAITTWAKGGGGKYHLYGRFNQLSDIMELFSVYVQPSVTEGFGITPLEAMAHGKPLIITDGTGSSYLIEDGKEGLIVPIRNPQAIADAIQYFRDNPSEVKRMSRNARLTAEKYDWNKIEEQYKKLYRGLI